MEVFEGEVGSDAPLLVHGLAQAGIEVEVCCPADSAPLFEGVPVLPVTVGANVGSLAALRRMLRAGPASSGDDDEHGDAAQRHGGADVVHAHGLRAGQAVSLARPSGVPFVLSWSDPVPASGPAGLAGWALARTVVPAAAVTIAATPEIVDAAQRLGAREVRLSPPLLRAPGPTRDEEEVREDLALPSDGPIVLAHARLQTNSRLDVLIDAAARWRQRSPAPQVVIAGVGPAFRDLAAQAVVARAPVTFVGERADATPLSPSAAEQDPEAHTGERPATLDDLIAAASVAVVTAPRERPGFALRAALAGVAVVAPEGGAVARLLGDAVRTVAPVSADALDEAVRSLLDEPDARADIGRAARATLAAWPTADDRVAMLAELYAAVSATHDAP